MSEFISTCPKCAQQILCDTAYVGRRIACPKCLQVIQMPEPGQGSGPVAGSQAAAAGAGGRGGNTMVLAAIGGAVVIVVAVAAVLVLRKPATVAPSTPASTASVQAAAPAPGATAAPAPMPTLAVQTTPSVRTKPAVKPPVMPPELLAKCRAIWTFDQDSGDTVLDATGNGYNGKLVGNTAVWLKAESSDSSGLRMDGSECVEVAAPVVNTSESFTVTTWVKLDVMEAKKPQTIVSIDGTTNSGFDLGYFPYTGAGATGGRFELLRPTGDMKEATAIRALTLHGVYTKNWYHLAGVYDAKDQTISLYLNGDLQTNMPSPGVWQATGKTAIGRGAWMGRPARYFQGIVRDVRLFSGALTADQIKQIAH